ncbi:MAG: hypothetical protein WED10_11615 [Brumimicrobium sp.]
MKKFIIGIFSTTMLIAAATSCKKEEQTPREAGSATVKGMVRVNSDVTNDTLSDGSPDLKWENAPSGTKLTFIINGYDLDPNPDPTYNYKNEIYSASVGGDGSYSVSLPAYETPITASVQFDDFETDFVDYSNDPADTTANGNPAPVGERTVFSRADATVTIYDGAVVIEDYQY